MVLSNRLDAAPRAPLTSLTPDKAASIAVQNFGTYVLTEEDVQDLRD